MFFSFSSLISALFLCNLLVIFVWFYLRDIDRMIQIGIKSTLIFISFVTIRLILPIEFTFSNSLASTHIMPNIRDVLHATVVSIFNIDFTVLHTICLVWAVGIVVSTIMTVKSHLRFRQVMNEFPILHNLQVDKIVQTIVKEYKKPVSFQIVYSNLVGTPMLYGFLNPKIIVPSIDSTQEEWYFILKHEITHYYNRDLQIKLFVQLLRVIYWWNPFIYLLNNDIDKMLEIRNDLGVIKSLNEHEKIKYLECLLKVVKKFPSESPNYYSAALGSGKGSEISQRFHVILGNYKPSNIKRLKAILMGIPLVVLSIFSFITVFEPYSIAFEDEINTVGETNTYLVENPEGGYALYSGDTYIAEVNFIEEHFSDLPIYKNKSEAKQK